MHENILVAVGDLAAERVDAVVRPADAQLGPAEPVAARLDEAGGEAFALLRRNTTPLEAGAAVVTGGGGLLTALVLHVVIAESGRKVGRELLRKALVSAWQRAGDWGCGSSPPLPWAPEPVTSRCKNLPCCWWKPFRPTSSAVCTSSWTPTPIWPWSRPPSGGRRDPVDRAHQALRKIHRGKRHRSRGAARRAVRLARPQWRRQDHDHPHDRGHPPSHERRGRPSAAIDIQAVRSRPRRGSATSPTGPSSTTS